MFSSDLREREIVAVVRRPGVGSIHAIIMFKRQLTFQLCLSLRVDPLCHNALDLALP
jgi:hypothetical protein